MLRRFYAQAFLCLGVLRHMRFYASCLNICSGIGVFMPELYEVL